MYTHGGSASIRTQRRLVTLADNWEGGKLLYSEAKLPKCAGATPFPSVFSYKRLIETPAT